MDFMARPDRVIVYTQPGCTGCHAEKTWLSRRGIAFEERDIRADPKWLSELQALGAKATPATLIEAGGRRQVVSGFDEHQLLHALDIPNR